MPLAPCLEAAGETWRDDELRELGRTLWAQGVSEVPVISVGEHWFRGVAGLMAAGAQLRQAVSAQRRGRWHRARLTRGRGRRLAHGLGRAGRRGRLHPDRARR